MTEGFFARQLAVACASAVVVRSLVATVSGMERLQCYGQWSKRVVNNSCHWIRSLQYLQGANGGINLGQLVRNVQVRHQRIEWLRAEEVTCIIQVVLWF